MSTRLLCLTLLLFLILATFPGCDSDLSDDPIPYQPFPSLIIDVTLPSNNSLNTLGWKTFNSAGVRGVIVYKASSTNYIAFERNCSYHPNDACATVDVHSTNLYMIDACCQSTFDFTTGAPRTGPAWRNLRQYVTTLNGSIVTVTDEIVE